MTIEEKYGWIEKQVNDFFSYEQRFIIMNAGRGLGKTYSTQINLLKRAINKRREIGYIVRNQYELDQGVVWDAFEKVIEEKFPEYEFEVKGEEVFCNGKRDEEKNPFKIIRGFALKKVQFYKKHSYPKVDWLFFDEYMIEKDSGATYVKGYAEPTLLMKLYDTIDRRQDRVRVFLIGNTTIYYNPYHISEFFKQLFIKKAEKGEIKKISNAVFWRADPPESVKEEMAKSTFSQMISGTAYGEYANEGEYEDDIIAVEPMTSGCKCKFALQYNQQKVYVYSGNKDGENRYWISLAEDRSVPCFGVRGNDVGVNVPAFKISMYYQLFEYMWNTGHIYFANQKAKTITQDFLWYILSSYRKV